MRLILLVVLVLNVLLIEGFAQSGRTREYEVYSAVIRYVSGQFGQRHARNLKFIVLNRTFINKDYAKDPPEDLPFLAKELLRKNSTSIALRRRFSLRNVYLISQHRLNKLFEEGKYAAEKRTAELEKNGTFIGAGCNPSWTVFDAKYHNAFGFFKLSRVAFSNSGKTAMVYGKYENACSGLESVYVLRRPKSRWKIVAASGGAWIL